MRAAPALQVSVTRFGVWRAAVWIAGAIAFSLLAAWVFSHCLARAWPAARPQVAVGAAAALLTAALIRRLLKVDPFDLRFDGRSWHLGRPAAPAADPIAGDVRVAVDLGSFLLLRFESEWPGEDARRYWLALQRRGLEAAWHGLRCAVHSPHPRLDAAPAPE